MDPTIPPEPLPTDPAAPATPATPAAPAWSVATPETPSRATRPASVTLAGILLIALGGLQVLLALPIVLVGGLASGMADDPTLARALDEVPPGALGLVAVIGLIVLVIGAVQVVSGAFLIPGRAWARITAIAISALAGLATLIGLAASAAAAAVPAVILMGLAASYGFVTWTLAVNGRAFPR